MQEKFFKRCASLLTIAVVAIAFTACEKDDEDPIIETKIVEKDPPRYQASINLLEKVNGNEVIYNTSNKPYQNKRGQSFNITKLRYLISDITFHKEDGNNFTIDDYHLFDNSVNGSEIYEPEIKVPAGEYEYISFTFGFDRADNQSGIYTDLNLANWAWPGRGSPMGDLGGGYHYMQLEGSYDSSGTSKGYEVHMGKARNNNYTPPVFENNHFITKLDSSAIKIEGDFSFSLVMNVEQWFENPYEWDFNVFNVSLMGNYDAQRNLNINGPSVFTYYRQE